MTLETQATVLGPLRVLGHVVSLNECALTVVVVQVVWYLCILNSPTVPDCCQWLDAMIL